MNPRLVRIVYSVPVALGAVFLLGLVLRVGCVDCHGLWNDEVISIDVALDGPASIFSNRFGWLGNQTTWYYLLVWLTSLPVDPVVTPVLVRLPSVLAGVLLPLLVYGLGRELFSRGAGLIAALITALAPVMLNYSHDARPYSLLAFLTTASVFCLAMAERTHRRGWWLGFAAATIANMLNAYVALTLALPAMAPYMAWVLWKSWRARKQAPQQFAYALASYAVTAVVAGAMLLEIMQMPRVPADLGRFSVLGPFNIAQQLLVWFGNTGMDGPLGQALAMLFVVLALAGAVVGARHGKVRGVAICLLMSMVPSALLAVLITTNPVLQRYALFIGPFYFLLIGNAVMTSATGMQKDDEAERHLARLARPVVVVLSVFVLLGFSTGTINYFNPERHRQVSYRPDFRGVVRTLEGRVKPGDMLVLADDPGIGINVVGFYWRAASVPVLDARDPMLAAGRPTGDVYWIVSSMDPQLLEVLAADARFEVAAKGELVLAVKEKKPSPDVVAGLRTLAGAMSPAAASERHVLTLLGTTAQAGGGTSEAADAYFKAGTFLPLADEYLRTADGYARLGRSDTAWREAVIAKSMQPGDPTVHKWLADHLMAQGQRVQAEFEYKIVEDIRRVAAAAAEPQSR